MPPSLPAVLLGWPAPCRLMAVLTGVLPVCGVLRGRSPLQYRVCSGPGLVSLLISVGITTFETMFLILVLTETPPMDLVVYVVFSLLAGLTPIASTWLLTARGKRIPDLLKRADEALETCKTPDNPVPMKCSITHLLIAVAAMFWIGLYVWQLHGIDSVLALNFYNLPHVIAETWNAIISIRMLIMLSLSLHLMKVFTVAFDDISATLERRLSGNVGPCQDSMPQVAVTSCPSFTAVLSCRPEDPGQWVLPSPLCSADISAIRLRYLTISDALTAFNDVYALPSLLHLCYKISTLLGQLTMPAGSLSGDWKLRTAFLGLETALFVVLLCQHGQLLEDAARRPALLLLRNPLGKPAAAEEAARLVALTDALRPSAGTAGIPINGSLLATTLAGFVTYLVVLRQMMPADQEGSPGRQGGNHSAV